MSLITWPSDLAATNFNLALSTNQRVSASPFGGSEQAIDLLNDRWTLSMEVGQQNYEVAATLEAFIGAMRGATNKVELWHFARPTPKGTLIGSPTAQATAQGASSIVLNTTTGYTLKAGDMIGVSGLLLQVASDCTAVSSEITVPIVNRLRKSISSGAAVTWSSPVATFRLLNKASVPYSSMTSDSVQLEFGEAIE